MTVCVPIDSCIACGKSDLIHIIDMNNQPLANSFKSTRDAAEAYYPLKINKCNNCHHLQLSHMVHPDELFKYYIYVSGTSNTQLEYFTWFSSMVYDKIGKKNGKVLDIGCNDGSQLNSFRNIGFSTYGIDPAENLHSISSKNHNVICNYFNDPSVVFPVKFDAIVCQNAFSHNYDQKQFLEKCKNLLTDDGLLFITISQANMIKNGEFDTIYHEHYSYYTVNSMKTICERANVFLTDVLYHPIHGNSYIFVISKISHSSDVIHRMIEDERKDGLFDNETYIKYRETAIKKSNEFASIVTEFRSNGYYIIGYGSPAKGNTMLNFSGVTLDFIIDDNPLKQNLFTPGSSIPIYASEYLSKYSSDDKVCFVPLAWNFFDEIIRRLKSKWTYKPINFIKYFPQVEFIHADVFEL